MPPFKVVPAFRPDVVVNAYWRERLVVEENAILLPVQWVVL